MAPMATTGAARLTTTSALLNMAVSVTGDNIYQALLPVPAPAALFDRQQQQQQQPTPSQLRASPRLKVKNSKADGNINKEHSTVCNGSTVNCAAPQCRCPPVLETTC